MITDAARVDGRLQSLAAVSGLERLADRDDMLQPFQALDVSVR